MTVRKVLLAVGAIGAMAGLVTVAVILSLLLPGSPATQSSPASSATPSPPSDIVGAKTINDALFQARPAFGAGEKLVLAEIQSVSYVKTTFGEAVNLFNPNRPGGWHIPDDAPVWAFVGYGQFQWAGPLAAPTPGPIFTTVWVIITEGKLGGLTGGSNQEYDLSQLGTVVEIPLSVFEKCDRRSTCLLP